MESKYTKLIERVRWQAEAHRLDSETAREAADAIETLSRSIAAYAKANEELLAWRRNAEEWMNRVAEEKAAAYHRDSAAADAVELRKPDPAETTHTATRKSILHDAEKCVCGQRQLDYGTPEDNFATIARMWEAYRGVAFDSVDVAMMMALLKIARVSGGGGSEDSFVDLAGYAACGGEIWANREEG